MSIFIDPRTGNPCRRCDGTGKMPPWPGSKGLIACGVCREEEPSPRTVFACGKPGCIDGVHTWDGPIVARGNMGSVSCSKCGVLAFDVDNFMGGA